jgi:hypothetical protein
VREEHPVNHRTPEIETDPGRSGLQETIAARFAAEDAARAAWLDARTGTGRRRAGTWPARRAQTVCAGCGLKSGHHPGCREREERLPAPTGTGCS